MNVQRTHRRNRRARALAPPAIAFAIALFFPIAADAQTARERYTAALAAEQTVRSLMTTTDVSAPAATRTGVIRQARQVIASYSALVRKYHGSGYSDNALFNAAKLSELLYEKFGQAHDRTAAAHFMKRLVAEYPTSSLVRARADASAKTNAATKTDAPSKTDISTKTEAPAKSAAVAVPVAPPIAKAKLTSIERTILPEAVRITLALDREVPYREESLNGPARVFFDLKGVEAVPALTDAVLRYTTDAVRQIRVGRHPDNTVRVVLDLEGIRRHTVYALYNPFRIVIDAEPLTAATAAVTAVNTPTPAPAPVAAAPVATPPPAPPARVVPVPIVEPEMAVPSTATVTTPSAAPEAPVANGAGGFSIARQLGLGVSRIVIDPGHGGHDPGAMVKGLNEAELTLDIALRLEKLLQNEPGLDVVLTRRTNVYVPLEERTAIANREGADLFLSIHANASRNTAARGVETYFLSFASSPDAETVAARENSASARNMHTLPDIVKAITLNNKLDESKDFAGMVQEALITRLKRSNKNVRNLGVKKAPFVVLIGAEMPSVLAEVSFLTNKQELQLLRTPSYKQRIADALHAAVLRYRRSLKGSSAVASQ